jgi:molybdopterin-biosynthesis enzyme MoeA-like protein
VNNPKENRIGPTHGDITADSVAKTFGVPIDTDPRALASCTNG